MIDCAQGDSGVTKCPTPGVLTIRELGCVSAAAYAQASEVTESKLPDRISVGMSLTAGSPTETGAAGTSQTRQSSKKYVNCGGSASTERR
jgi:hypothetical protein